MPLSLKTTLRKIGFLLLLYSGVRFLFLLNNWSHLKNETSSVLLAALAHGVRFDLSILLTINLIFIFLWISPLKLHSRPWFEQTLHILFVLVNAFFLVANISDIELVNFNARRMTWAFFSLKKDVSAQLPQLMAYYWWWTTLSLSTLPVLFFLTPKRLSAGRELRSTTLRDRVQLALCYLVFVFLIVLGIRGGLQNKPVREAHAFQSSAMVGNLILNTPFTLVHSRKKSFEKEVGFFSDEDIRKILNDGLGESDAPVIPPPLGGRAKNVVLIILESFSREYMGEINGREGYTPFLDSLVNKSLFFANHHANARRSIDAIPAILSGLPALLREPFLLSSYQAAQVRGLAQVLAGHKYKTAFFHGAENGSMFFDSFTQRIGYEKYYGMNEYPEPKRDWDGFWGMLDEPFLQFFAGEISHTPEPFFSTIFTLSSHQPYPVPESLKDKFPTGTLEIHKSIGYTDYALRKFFETAEKQPWFKDTLFVITADHTSKGDDPAYGNLLGPYRVPLLFYQAGAKWAGVKVQRVTQHIDISASVLDYLGIQDEKIIPLGQSVFSRKEGFFVARESDYFIFHSTKCTGKMSAEGEWQVGTASEGCIERDKNFLKAYVQYFINGVIRNSLF